MVKIFTPYEDEKPKRVPNNPGNIMEPQYKERYDENGNATLSRSERSTRMKKSRATKTKSTL
jgi:hypothetical protein